MAIKNVVSYMLKMIKGTLPNFPEEVITVWLEPFSKRIGWPPKHQSWQNIFMGCSVDYWRTVWWEKKTINFDALELTPSYKNMVETIIEYYGDGKDFSSGSQQRITSILKYMSEKFIFPHSPIFILENRRYKIADGNHRFAAYIILHELSKEACGWPDNKKQKFNKIMKDLGILVSRPSLRQDVWIGTFQESGHLFC